MNIMVIIISLVSVVSAILSLLTRSAIFLFATPGICLILLAVVAAAEYKRKAQARTNHQVVASLKAELSQHQAIVEQLLPVLEILLQEDAALRALSGVSYPEPRLGNPPASPLDQVKTLLDSFSADRKDALARLAGYIPLRTFPDELQEIKLRLPYIDLLLQRVVQYTESVVLTLLERFGAISEQSESGARDAGQAMRSLGVGAATDNNQSLEHLIQESHESIVNRSAVIQEFLTLNKENTARIRKISNLVEKTEEMIIGIEDISERSKLITFNLAVESAKIGTKGLGFKVIVNELQKLNNQTSDFAKNILEIVKTFNSYNADLLDHWILRSESLTQKVQADTDQASKTVEALTRSYELTRSLFKSLSENAIAVNESMGDILASLQFQDITRQQIEGIETFLVDIRATVDALFRNLTESGLRCRTAGSSSTQLRDLYAPRLKVTSDHDIFELVERSTT